MDPAIRIGAQTRPLIDPRLDPRFDRRFPRRPEEEGTSDSPWRTDRPDRPDRPEHGHGTRPLHPNRPTQGPGPLPLPNTRPPRTTSLIATRRGGRQVVEMEGNTVMLALNEVVAGFNALLDEEEQAGSLGGGAVAALAGLAGTGGAHGPEGEGPAGPGGVGDGLDGLDLDQLFAMLDAGVRVGPGRLAGLSKAVRLWRAKLLKRVKVMLTEKRQRLYGELMRLQNRLKGLRLALEGARDALRTAILSRADINKIRRLTTEVETLEGAVIRMEKDMAELSMQIGGIDQKLREIDAELLLLGAF